MESRELLPAVSHVPALNHSGSGASERDGRKLSELLYDVDDGEL